MFYLPNLRRKKTLFALVGVILCIALAVVLFYLLKNANQNDRLEQDRLHQLNEELRQTFDEDDDEKNESNILRDKLKKYDFYQKLREGLQVNALFLGNGASTATSSGQRQWVFDAVAHWERTFGIDIQGGNYARVNTTAFYGYTMMNEYPRGLRYDLVVVSYGAQDDPADFAFYYDGLLRSIKNQNAKCEIFCVIEANADGYSENAETVRLLSDYYGAVCIDMIQYFKDNGVSFETALDGINPTPEGSDVYLEAIKSVVQENLDGGRKVPERTATYDAKATCFDKFSFVEAKSLSKDTVTSYEYVTDDPVVGIMYYNTSDGGTIRIYADGKLVSTIDNRLKEAGVRQITTAVAGKNFEGRTVIRVEAGSKDNLTNIAGIITCSDK